MACRSTRARILYALGILAYEMLTGRVPFHDENPMNVLQMHLRQEVPPMPQTVPYNVQQVVRRALEKEPSRRYQSAGEMMQHCQQIFSELNQGAPSMGAGGVPKTMIAARSPLAGPGGPPPGFAPGGPPPPMGGPPPAMGGGPGPGGFRSATPQQKTVFGGAAPQIPGVNAPGGPPPGMGGAPGPGGFRAAPPQQKTMIAGNAAALGINLPGGPPPGMGGPPPGMGGPPPPMGGPPPGMGGGGGPAKTVMLQSSEGVVSVAHTGAPVPALNDPGGGASVAFWIVSMLIGVGLGALAYVIVLQF